MGGSRVEEEVRGTVVCWDMVFCVLFFRGWLSLWCWMGVERGREGGGGNGIDYEKREREKFVTMLFCHLDYLYLL